MICRATIWPRSRPLPWATKSPATIEGRAFGRFGITGTGDCGDWQHPMAAKQKIRPSPTIFSSIASADGCGGSQHPILAIGREHRSETRGVSRYHPIFRQTSFGHTVPASTALSSARARWTNASNGFRSSRRVVLNCLTRYRDGGHHVNEKDALVSAGCSRPERFHRHTGCPEHCRGFQHLSARSSLSPKS